MYVSIMNTGKRNNSVYFKEKRISNWKIDAYKIIERHGRMDVMDMNWTAGFGAVSTSPATQKWYPGGAPLQLPDSQDLVD